VRFFFFFFFFSFLLLSTLHGVALGSDVSEDPDHDSAANTARHARCISMMTRTRTTMDALAVSMHD
jgi:hypothetical protein